MFPHQTVVANLCVKIITLSNAYICFQSQLKFSLSAFEIGSFQRYLCARSLAVELLPIYRLCLALIVFRLSQVLPCLEVHHKGLVPPNPCSPLICGVYYCTSEGLRGSNTRLAAGKINASFKRQGF